MATASKSPSALAHASAEKIAPQTSAVINWVHQQSQHDQPPGAAKATRRVQMATPPQIKTKVVGSSSDHGRPRRLVYEAATLLKLRNTQCAVPVMLRVKPEAIAENIFQYMGASSTRRCPTRSRGLSEISNLSRGSFGHRHYDKSSYTGAASGSFGQAMRQPIAPPQSSILQQHDGFARFLKQHASPPHHRVTAGGRIVPAGPSSPPPMLDFGSLNTIVRDQKPATGLFQKGSRLTNITPQLPQETQSQSNNSLASGTYPLGQEYTAIAHSLFPNTVPAAFPCNNITSAYQPVISPVLQTATAMVPLALLTDGSTILSCNGINYRGSWNGVTMILEPLQMLPPATYQQPYTTGNISAPSNDSLVDAHQPSLSLVSSSQSFKEQFVSHAGGNNEEDLKIQLTNLDKYLALYHYEITPAERAVYVTQRRQLVEKIDKIRVSKDRSKHGIPIIEPTTGVPIIPTAHYGPKAQAKPRTSSAIQRAIQSLEPSKDASSNKVLSPAAPAFVPKDQQTGSAAISKCHATQQPSKTRALDIQGPRLRGLGQTNLQDVTKAAISRKDRALHANDLDTKATTHQHTSSSSVLDPSDPGMRIIDYEDIEYAERYLYNWTQDTKTYCTSVAEFQEAIRRVREQARMYGCEGGQSKDPAYDAEQDIWWAICDRDPIPLPSKLADHIANPRPWNWNDSAFNYRREGAALPGPECDKARNSPRLAGWDPIITEAMKDRTDVSRSYFALKGQLPSVPFRDFEFDRHGNKINIESRTAVASPTMKASWDKNDRKTSSVSKAANAPETALEIENNVLKDMSTSDLNSRRTSATTLSRNKSDEKQSFPEGAALNSYSQSAIRTSLSKPDKSVKEDPGASSSAANSNLSASDLRKKTKPKEIQQILRPYQSYVEEYPETPAARQVRADSRGSPTPHIRKSSKTMETHDILDANAKKHPPFVSDAIVKQEYIPYSVPGWVRAPIDVNDPWYGSPTDPVTLEYLARLKEWCPGDGDVLETMAAEQKNRAEQNEELASDEAVHASMIGLHGPKHKTPQSKHDHNAETRSPWGPEQSSPFFDTHQRSIHSKLPELTATPQSFEAGQTTKVNLPNARYNRVQFIGENSTEIQHTTDSGHGTLQPRATNSVKADSGPKIDSHNFLRKMLKSPTFTSAQSFRFPARLSSKPNNNNLRDVAISNTNTENKAIRGAAKLVGTGKDASVQASTSKSTLATRPASNVSLSKAQSSLASSSYQAQGYLPQFCGAGKAYTASLCGDRIDQAPPSPVRVNLPPHTSYEGNSNKTERGSYQAYQGADVHGVSTKYHAPITFGFDGGADAPPAKTAMANSINDPNFDYKGVSAADYEIQRPDPDSAWHQGEVEDFFQDLAKEENAEILFHRRVHTQSAA